MTSPRDVPHSDLCEWDPERDRASQGDPVYGDPALKWRNYTGCPNLADVIVGADGKWRLCESCAALPTFKRWRVRKPARLRVS